MQLLTEAHRPVWQLRLELLEAASTYCKRAMLSYQNFKDFEEAGASGEVP